MSDLLPRNATPQEVAVAAVMEAICAPQVEVREVWNPDACPPHVLPWLAWAMSVDSWDPAWSVLQKREMIRTAIEVQRIKGTAGAVRLALGSIGIGARVLEWHQQETPGDPFTYRLLLEAGANAATLEAILAAIDIVDRTKSLRSHLEEIEVSASSAAGPYVHARASIGTEITVRFHPAAMVATEDEVVMI